MSVLIIAEAGVNHNGDIDIAKKLCLAAKNAGADVVKFQTWITEDIITQNVEKASYQSKNTSKVESQFDMLKKLELSQEEFIIIKDYCDKIGITFASTGDDIKSVLFLKSLNVPFLKIGSGDIGNIPHLRFIGSLKLPVILSTGMSNLSDIEISIEALIVGGAEDISLLHTTTSYPCSYDNVNLHAMNTLKNAFGLNVGYSDHTQGIEIPIAAVSLGATIIVKHITLDRFMDGPDHLASTDPDEFKRMVDSIRNIEKALGARLKKPTKEETIISNVVLKKIVAFREIPKGKIIELDDITTKRNTTGISAKHWDLVIGTKATKSYAIDEPIVF